MAGQLADDLPLSEHAVVCSYQKNMEEDFIRIRSCQCFTPLDMID